MSAAASRVPTSTSTPWVRRSPTPSSARPWRMPAPVVWTPSTSCAAAPVIFATTASLIVVVPCSDGEGGVTSRRDRIGRAWVGDERELVRCDERERAGLDLAGEGPEDRKLPGG